MLSNKGIIPIGVAIILACQLVMGSVMVRKYLRAKPITVERLDQCQKGKDYENLSLQ